MKVRGSLDRRVCRGLVILVCRLFGWCVSGGCPRYRPRCLSLSALYLRYDGRRIAGNYAEPCIPIKPVGGGLTEWEGGKAPCIREGRHMRAITIGPTWQPVSGGTVCCGAHTPENAA